MVRDAPERTPKKTQKAEGLVLPNSVVTKPDIGRLIRELQSLDAAMKSATAKKSDAKLPPTTRLLNDITEQNKLNMMKVEDRVRLSTFFETLRSEAPTLHFSFSSDPSPRFTSGLITWLRREIHPLVLLQIGLEPTLGVGCILRTTNRYFDLSIRQQFEDQQQLLISKITEGAA